MRRACAALALAVVVAVAGPASGHAELVSTSPGAGQVLDEAPDIAVVRFDEAVQADRGAVRLHDATGGRVDVGDLERADGGRTLTVDLPDLDDGGYVLTWRVVSLDGHPISGGVTWRIGARSAAVDRSLLQELLDAEGGDDAVAVAGAVARTLLFAAVLVLAGGVVFVLVVWPAALDDRRLVRMLRTALLLAGVATVAGIGIQGADVAGLGLVDAVAPSSFGDTFDTDYGRWALVRFAVLVGLAALLWRATPGRARRLDWRIAAMAGLVAVFASVALAGHARTGRWAGLAVPIDVAHLLAAAAWIGGLVVLAVVVLPTLEDSIAMRLAERFSTMAAIAVAVVVGTGVVQGIRQVEDVDGLRDTNYGRLLVIKVVIVALVVVLGAFSRSLVRGRARLEDDVDPGDLRRAVRRSVTAEALIAVVVVAVTSLLVAADPARVESARPYEVSRVVESTTIQVAVAPARRGPVDFHIYAIDASIGLTERLEATATLSLPDRDIPPIEVPIRFAGGRHWSAYDVDVPISGDWRLVVGITVGEFERREATFTIPID